MKQSKTTKLYRVKQDSLIGGVAAGLADSFEVDANLVRIIFILLLFVGGVGLVLYLAMWLLLPVKGSASTSSSNLLKDNSTEVKTKIKSIGNSVNIETPDSINWFSVILLVLGVFLLLKNFGFLDWFELRQFWPAILIFIGLLTLKSR